MPTAWLPTLPVPGSWKKSNILAIAFVAALCSASYLLAVFLHSPSLSPSLPLPPLPLLLLLVTLTPLPPPSSPPPPSLLLLQHHHPRLLPPPLRPRSRSQFRYQFRFRFTACSSIPLLRRQVVGAHPVRGAALLPAVPARAARVPGAALPAAAGEEAAVPDPGAPRVPDAFPVAGEPRRGVVRQRAAHGAGGGEGGQNWIRAEGEVLRFPGGGTMFSSGADRYIDDIARAAVPSPMAPSGPPSIPAAG
uniref:Uncharacterized protein n=1 Tax=Ananas comosus var. bracteatus TaxID=296719 RepID=A0A6V7PHN5_ANACO|nr:unnamed protein product [Ananas comosus var. bracteatus]